MNISFQGWAMGASVVQLTESAFHEILQFVATSGRLSERKSLYASLRQLGGGVLNLDEMVIGHCASAPENAQPDRCSHFDPVVSLSEAPPNLPLSPCASAKSASGCGGDAAAVPQRRSYEADSTNGRVVVCHRRTVEAPSLCIVSSARERTAEELLALLKTLLPYVDDAFQRIEPEHPECDASGRAEAGAGANALTGREKEVLHWTARGKGCWETGEIVGISERTVKFHLHNIYRKLNVVNRAQAVARAAQINLLQVAT